MLARWSRGYWACWSLSRSRQGRRLTAPVRSCRYSPSLLPLRSARRLLPHRSSARFVRIRPAAVFRGTGTGAIAGVARRPPPDQGADVPQSPAAASALSLGRSHFRWAFSVLGDQYRAGGQRSLLSARRVKFRYSIVSISDIWLLGGRKRRRVSIFRTAIVTNDTNESAASNRWEFLRSLTRASARYRS